MKKPYDFARATFLPFQLPDKFLLRLAAWLGLMITILYAASIYLAAPVFIDLVSVFEASMNNPNDPAIVGQIFSFYGKLISRLFIVMILFGVVFVAAETALHKKVQHGIDHGFFPMRLGGTEGRSFVAMLCVYFFTMAAAIVGAIVMTILMVIFAGISGGEPGPSMIIGMMLGYILLYGAMIWVGIRFAPAASMTVRDGKIKIFESLSASKGRFWWMFLSYIVVYIISTIVSYVGIFAIMVAAMTALPVEQLSQGGSSVDPAEIVASLLTPGKIILYLILGYFFAFLTSIFYVCLWGVGSYVTELDGAALGDDTFS